MGSGFSSIEDYVKNHLRLFIFSVLALLVILAIAAVTVFFIAVHGEEQTMVPDLVGKELTEALIEMQIKELYPRIDLRYTQTSRDKGFILEQDPPPGQIVKAGRRIRLVVSQGVIVNRVENFVTRNIDDVRMDMMTLLTAAGGVPLLSIREPVMYEFSAERPGTILAQRPEPGTSISGPLSMDFVVSRGRDNQTITVPQFAGLSISSALYLISETGVNFRFTQRERRDGERGETVVSQSQPEGSVISLNTPILLTVTAPEDITDSNVFGVFTYTIPENPYPLTVRLEALHPIGGRERLITVNFTGGEFTVPYKLPSGTVLILTMMNRELFRETI